jgi:hypothetical protein
MNKSFLVLFFKKEQTFFLLIDGQGLCVLGLGSEGPNHAASARYCFCRCAGGGLRTPGRWRFAG